MAIEKEDVRNLSLSCIVCLALVIIFISCLASATSNPDTKQRYTDTNMYIMVALSILVFLTGVYVIFVVG